MEQYEVIFDVNNGFKSWSFSAFGLIFVSVGVVLILVQKIFNFTFERRRLSRSLVSIGIIFSILTFWALR